MVHAESFGNYLEKFYKQEKTALEKHYPGLTYNRLRQEVMTLAAESLLQTDNLFETLYVPNTHNPLTRFIADVKRGVPLEYITGRAAFFKSEFFVNESVLIPRSETEILVERAVSELALWSKKTDEKLKVVDVGVGSGAIILSLLQESKRPIEAYGVDISRDALMVAKRNAYALRYTYHEASTLDLVHNDRLTDLFHDKSFHLIVSNPPYIKRENDKEKVHSQVAMYEPEVALYLDDNEYDRWYEVFFGQVFSRLSLEGIFLMEGHEDHLEYLAKMLRDWDFETIEILKDYNGLDRFIRAKK
jgi:release factor glutamine methyltransferase